MQPSSPRRSVSPPPRVDSPAPVQSLPSPPTQQRVRAASESRHAHVSLKARAHPLTVRRDERGSEHHASTSRSLDHDMSKMQTDQEHAMSRLSVHSDDVHSHHHHTRGRMPARRGFTSSSPSLPITAESLQMPIRTSTSSTVSSVEIPIRTSSRPSLKRHNPSRSRSHSPLLTPILSASAPPPLPAFPPNASYFPKHNPTMASQPLPNLTLRDIPEQQAHHVRVSSLKRDGVAGNHYHTTNSHATSKLCPFLTSLFKHHRKGSPNPVTSVI